MKNLITYTLACIILSSTAFADNAFLHDQEEPILVDTFTKVDKPVVFDDNPRMPNESDTQEEIEPDLINSNADKYMSLHSFVTATSLGFGSIFLSEMVIGLADKRPWNNLKDETILGTIFSTVGVSLLF